MVDWSRALADAFQRHVEIGGPSGPTGPGARKRFENNDLPSTSPGTTRSGGVVPLVTPGGDALVDGTSGTTGQAEVVPTPACAEPAENRDVCRSGTAGTSGTGKPGQVRRRPAALAAETFEKPTANAGDDSGTSREWGEGLAALDPADPLPGYTARRWQELIEDGHRFLYEWGAQAVRLGWGTLDLFGVHPGAPAVRFDVIGLVPLIRGGEVIAVEESRATIRMPSGSLLTYLRRPQPGAVPLWNGSTG